MWRHGPTIFKDEYYNKANRCERSGAVISPASCLARIVRLDVFVTLTVKMPQTTVVCPTLGSILSSTPLNPPRLLSALTMLTRVARLVALAATAITINGQALRDPGISVPSVSDPDGLNCCGLN